MKKLIYLLLLPLVVAVTACGGKVNSKKESVLATQDSVDARGIQRMQTSKSEIDIKFKGKDYRSFVSRTPDESLPHVTNEMGDTYMDNKIVLRLTRGGESVYLKTCKPDNMCQRMITILFLVCAFCIGGSAYGQKVNYQQFENIYLGAEASVISCFLQDSEGLIWIGSNKGLFSYDGYSTQQHFTYGERNNTRIYCGIIADNTYLYLGTDNGILVNNYRTDKYEQPETDFPTDVRTMALQGDTLWIGSLNGLYTYQLNTKKLASLDSKSNGLPHHTIYSIIRTTDNQIYVGT